MFCKVKRGMSSLTMQQHSAKDVLLVLSTESLFSSFYAMR